ncbi:MAG: aminotransferase class I/II-fold pyridoxal phosphate-dependent enzyme, partial [Halobacteria archaeon]|nr:aminotransferase class I/II-fold pyridoxal phosphate-dependent enzyme [Halobacteria archaeon]
VTVNSASKTFAMTGWRLGYVVGSSEAVDEMVKVHQYVQACAPAVSQHAVLGALTSDESEGSVEEMKEEFEARRDLLLERFDE